MKDNGYRICGVKDGWLVKTATGRAICTFMATATETSIEPLLRALKFIGMECRGGNGEESFQTN